jgi:hypothetical protein
MPARELTEALGMPWPWLAMELMTMFLAGPAFRLERFTSMDFYVDPDAPIPERVEGFPAIEEGANLLQAHAAWERERRRIDERFAEVAALKNPITKALPRNVRWFCAMTIPPAEGGARPTPGELARSTPRPPGRRTRTFDKTDVRRACDDVASLLALARHRVYPPGGGILPTE